MGTHYRGTAEQMRALDAYIKLERAVDSVGSRLVPGIAAAGLTTSQFGVLETLLHLGPLSPCELARKLLKSSGNLTLVLDNLERRGLIRRVRDRADRRYLTVHLTSEGEETIRALFPEHAERVTALFGALTAEEQAELARLCRRLGRAAAGLDGPGNPTTSNDRSHGAGRSGPGDQR